MGLEPDLEERVAWLEAALTKLAADVQPPVTLPPRPGQDSSAVSAEVRELVLAGQTIEAIRLHREQTGVDLAEAKRAIESADLS
jgi:ribosomal protein L7/L12